MTPAEARRLARRTANQVISGKCTVADAERVEAVLSDAGMWDSAADVRSARAMRSGLLKSRGFVSLAARWLRRGGP